MNILEQENDQEKKNHYNKDFSYNTYLCSIPLDFPSVPLHWHNKMELIYVKKGTGQVRVDLNTYPVSKGTIIVLAPGQLHAIDCPPGAAMEYENIIFNLNALLPRQEDSMSEQILEQIRNKSVLLPTALEPALSYYPETAACLNKADTICQTFPDGYSLALRGYLYEFFFLLYAHGRQERTQKPVRNLDKIKLITRYIEEHCDEDIPIADIASVCGFSSLSFIKNPYGMPL